MNVELLQKVADHIRRHPLNFGMGHWVDDSVDDCGTTCCIGGWAAVLSRLEKGRVRLGALITTAARVYKNDLRGLRSGPGCRVTSIRTDAQNLLELTDAQASRLFYAPGWPYKFYRPYTAACATREDADFLSGTYRELGQAYRKHSRVIAQIAYDRIQHFIRTKGRA